MRNVCSYLRTYARMCMTYVHDICSSMQLQCNWQLNTVLYLLIPRPPSIIIFSKTIKIILSFLNGAIVILYCHGISWKENVRVRVMFSGTIKMKCYFVTFACFYNLVTVEASLCCILTQRPSKLTGLVQISDSATKFLGAKRFLGRITEYCLLIGQTLASSCFYWLS